MGDATRTYFLRIFEETLTILKDASIPHLLIGSIAEAIHFSEEWDPASDIDLLVTEQDAARCLELFPEHGYATHVRDSRWISKIAKPNVTIDLIFRSADHVKLDDEIYGRGLDRAFEDIPVRVPSVEDMSILNLLLDSPERPGYVYTAMRYLERVEDWDYLADRGRRYAPEKVLGGLLLARDAGVEVPDVVAKSLAAACTW